MGEAADRGDIEHLLRRSGFGARTADVDALVGLDWEQAVDAVLDLSGAPDPAAGLPTVARAPAATTDWSGDYVPMVHHWLDRCATTATPIVEKMTLFWHGHLTSSASGVRLGPILDQHVLFQRSGLGRYDELVDAVAIDPAMLIYLDGKSSHRWSPNENFARELMELFCLGVGNYTEDDVRAAARAFTGYRVREGDDGDQSYYFLPTHHDEGDKTFMGVTKNWDGPAIIDHILNGPTRMIAARHLARRLWSFFAYPDPSDAIVDSLAATFDAADLELLPLVRAIFLHPEFRSDQCRNGLLRSPIELAVAAGIHTGLPASQIHAEWYLPDMGQRPFMPPNVDGWPQNEGYVATSTFWARSRFADRVGQVGADAGLLAGSESRTVDDAVMTALTTMGVTAPSQATRVTLASFVSQTRADEKWLERRGLLTMSLLSPEFALA
ncbi:DUF1800 domain-containing protein [Actinospongicola halichondriae]|uniref:DUF1800 domain-containing protein n=1 Tax=Actinospongicola halichondriae TaxID=3236844 RepID=UPI003D514841